MDANITSITGQQCLRLMALNWPPFLMIYGKDAQSNIGGSMIPLVEILAKHIGFCYEPFFPGHISWGKRLDNGTFTGMAGFFQRKEVDMSYMPVGVSITRMEVMDFAQAIHFDDQRVIHITPQPEADVSGFIKPFTSLVWLMILVGSLVLIVFFYIIELQQSLLQNKRKEDSTAISNFKADKDTNMRSFLKALHWTVSSLLTQSVPWDPKGMPVRIIAGMWLVVTLIVGSVYKGNLKAMLILPSIDLPFDNVEELIESKILTHIIPGSLSDHIVTNAPNDSLFGRLRHQTYRDGRFFASVERTYDGYHAGMGSHLGVQTMLHDAYSKYGYCHLYITSVGYFGGVSISFAFPKNSSLMPKIDEALMYLKAAGIPNMLFRNQIPNATNCITITSASLDTGLRPLALKDFYGAMSLFAAGCILAIMTLGVEKFGQRTKENAKQ